MKKQSTTYLICGFIGASKPTMLQQKQYEKELWEETIISRKVHLRLAEILDNYLKYWQTPSEDEDYVLASEVK